MLKSALLAIADLLDAWSDGSNDPGDLKVASDALADLLDAEFDDELDELLSKSYVEWALPIVASLIRKIVD